MAERDLMRAESGEEPVLLLDDVMSELDRPRRQALSEFIASAGQALVTCTDTEDFSAELVERARVLEVRQGHLEGGGMRPVEIEEMEGRE